MNKIYILLTLLLSLIACKSTKETPQPKELCKILSYRLFNNNGFSGEVVDYTYNASGKEIERKSLYDVYKSEYDSNNNLIKYSRYIGTNNSKLSEKILVYNTNNQLIKETFYYLSPPNGLVKQTETQYEYFASGKIKRMLFYGATTATLIINKLYNEQGSVIQINEITGSFVKNEYDGQNRLIKMIDYKADTKKTNEYTYQYNAKNLITKVLQTENGVPYINFVNEYDSKYRILNEIYYVANTNNITRKYTYVYSGDNYRKSTYSGNDNIVYYYDDVEMDGGLLKKKSSYNRLGITSTETYEYDLYKNLIKKETLTPQYAKPLREEWVYQCP